MAVTDERSAPNSDRDYAEILSQLRAIRETNGRPAPLPDPSINVKDQLASEVKRLDDIRILSEQHRRELREMEERYQRELAEARRDNRTSEKERLDAINEANTSNVALALGKTETQAVAQDRRIAVLEQNQYRGGGRDEQRTEQRTESRQTTQWAIGLAVFGGLSFVGILVSAAILIHH